MSLFDEVIKEPQRGRRSAERRDPDGRLPFLPYERGQDLDFDFCPADAKRRGWLRRVEDRELRKGIAEVPRNVDRLSIAGEGDGDSMSWAMSTSSVRTRASSHLTPSMLPRTAKACEPTASVMLYGKGYHGV